MKYSFPAIFVQDEYEPEFYNVFFPDILGAATFGQGFDNAIKMAKELLTTLLKDESIRNINPTPIAELQKDFELVLLVEEDFNA